MAASVLDVLEAMPARDWVTADWVARRFGVTHYAGKHLLTTLHKRGLISKGQPTEHGEVPYRMAGAGRQALNSKPTSVMNPERYWERQQGADAHHFARRTVAGRNDPDEYARRRALFETRKREGL